MLLCPPSIIGFENRVPEEPLPLMLLQLGCLAASYIILEGYGFSLLSNVTKCDVHHCIKLLCLQQKVHTHSSDCGSC